MPRRRQFRKSRIPRLCLLSWERRSPRSASNCRARRIKCRSVIARIQADRHRESLVRRPAKPAVWLNRKDHSKDKRDSKDSKDSRDSRDKKESKRRRDSSKHSKENKASRDRANRGHLKVKVSKGPSRKMRKWPRRNQGRAR